MIAQAKAGAHRDFDSESLAAFRAGYGTAQLRDLAPRSASALYSFYLTALFYLGSASIIVKVDI